MTNSKLNIKIIVRIQVYVQDNDVAYPPPQS
jgi:hypothetical protein